MPSQARSALRAWLGIVLPAALFWMAAEWLGVMA